MDILLVDDVAGVGDIGEIVSVRPGYGRNYLIPKGFGIEASAQSSKAIAHKMKQIEARKKRLKVEAEKISDEWKKLTVTTSLRVGSGGKVFGSVNAKDIAVALNEQTSMKIDRRRILLGEPLRKIGKFPVSVKLHAEVVSEFTVEIIPAAATEEEEKKAAEEARIQIETAVRKKQQKNQEEVSEEDELPAE
jgi:large subunit ribosomal protein L9